MCAHFGFVFGSPWVDFLGAQISPPALLLVSPAGSSHVRLVCQAFGRWQWSNHLASKVPAGQKALINNIDETARRLFQGTGRATMLQHPGGYCRAAARLMHSEGSWVSCTSLGPAGHTKPLLDAHVDNITCRPAPKDRTVMSCTAWAMKNETVQ